MDIQEYSVKITPLFAEADKIQSYLADNNFSDITKIIIDDNSFQIAFTDYSRAVDLKNFIDGQIIAATQIHADDPVLLPPDDQLYTPPRQHSPPPYPRRDDDRELRERDRDYSRRDIGYSSRRDLPPHPYRDEIPPPLPPRREKFHSRTLLVKGYPAHVAKRDVWNDFKSFGYLKQIEVRENIVYLQYDTEDDAINALMKSAKHDSPLVKYHIELIPDRPLNIPRFVIPLVVEDDPRGMVGEREPKPLH